MHAQQAKVHMNESAILSTGSIASSGLRPLGVLSVDEPWTFYYILSRDFRVENF